MGLEFWANVSAVWLSILCFVGLLIPLAISIFVVKGVHAAVDRTPRLLRQAQGYSRAARSQVERASRRVAEPVVHAHAHSSRWSVVLDRLLRQRRTN